MKTSCERIDESYASCRRMTRRAGSSFYPCFMLLPRCRRRAMETLYAFMRHTDDLGDNPQPTAARRDALCRWRASLERALHAAPEQDLSEQYLPEQCLPEQYQGSSGHELLPAVVDTVRRFHIPAEHLSAVIDGVEMDLDPKPYETFDELAVYCRRVASAVGLACIHIWGFRNDRAIEPAVKCGVAMQLTNILRDLKEDAAAGRVYLPLEDFRRCGYSVEELRCGVVNDPFRRLIELEAARATRHYHEGADLIEQLEPRGRRIFGMMMATYYRLLEQVRRRADELLERRIRLGRWQKIRIATRWLLLPPRRSALP